MLAYFYAIVTLAFLCITAIAWQIVVWRKYDEPIPRPLAAKKKGGSRG